MAALLGQEWFISSMSINLALSALFEGTSGAMRDLMLQHLSYEPDAAKRHQSVSTLMSAYQSVAEEFTLQISNSIYPATTFEILQSFSDALTQNYSTAVKPLDYKEPGAHEIINKDIAEKTNDRIKNVLKPLDALTVIVLVNTIYFKAKWFWPFKKNLTYQDQFKNGENLRVSYMVSDKKGYRWMETESGDFLVDLPYKFGVPPKTNQRFSMVVFMPKGELQELKTTDLMQLMDNKGLGSGNLELHLPKFKLESKINMKDILTKMGLDRMFSASDDDFKNMTEEKGIYVSDVIHQTFVEVDEDGTEAAAATVITMALKCLPPKARTVKIDRPFGFWIVETTQRTVLFSGKIHSPVAPEPKAAPEIDPFEDDFW